MFVKELNIITIVTDAHIDPTHNGSMENVDVSQDLVLLEQSA